MLPKNLYGYIHLMASLQSSDGLEVIAARAIFFVKEIRPKPAKLAPSPTQTRPPLRRSAARIAERFLAKTP